MLAIAIIAAERGGDRIRDVRRESTGEEGVNFGAIDVPEATAYLLVIVSKFAFFPALFSKDKRYSASGSMPISLRS